MVPGKTGEGFERITVVKVNGFMQEIRQFIQGYFSFPPEPVHFYIPKTNAMKFLSIRYILFRLIHAVLCLVLVIQVNGQRKVLYASNPPEGFAASRIAKQALKDDMRYWQQVLEESHVNPYHAISREQMKALQDSLLNALPDSVTHFQACFAISTLAGALDEGHLGFETNRVSDSLYTYHAVRFPFLLFDIENGALVVQRDLSAVNKLPAYSRITEINGIPVQQLYERYRKFYGGLEPWRRLQVKNNFRKLLFMDGITSPFRIKALVNNQPVEYSTEGFSYQQTDSISKLIAAEMQKPAGPFSMRFLPGNIAFIEFNDMNGKLRESFEVFIKEAFTQIRDKQAAGVIIDIRKNGGGDSGLGDLLISYISDKPYRGSAGVKMRISSHSKANAVLRGAADPFADWENGKLYEYDVRKLSKPGKNKLRYKGKVAVLIGTGTFNSANMLTNAIKDYQLATLIGEPTAEPGNDFGEIFPFMLPNTYINATTAIKMFMRANGDTGDFSGIKPDIEVRNSPEDIQNKKDRVLDRALQWIQEGR